MNKAELTEKIANRCNCTRKQADLFLSAFCEIVSAAVAVGEKVTLVGFGSFEARDRAEREGRNPKTGEPMQIPARTVPAFSPGKTFKERVSS